MTELPYELIVGKIETTGLKSVADLIVSSPPYGIGKTYEQSETLESYTGWAEKIVPLLKKSLRPNAAVCWQVGTHVGKDLSLIHI